MLTNSIIHDCLKCKHSSNIDDYVYCNLFDELILFDQISCSLHTGIVREEELVL